MTTSTDDNGVREIDAAVAMPSLKELELNELLDDWRDEVNALIEAELLREQVVDESGRAVLREFWHIPEHELRLEVRADFVPTDFHGIKWIGKEAVHWNAVLDLDASHEIPASTRKYVYVYCVNQED